VQWQARTPDAAPNNSNSNAIVCCRAGIECILPPRPPPPPPTRGSAPAEGSGGARRLGAWLRVRCGGGGPFKSRSAARECGMGLRAGRRTE
jgi:hypothetical protein